MKKIIAIILFAFACSSYAKTTFLCDRIGSTESNAVPTEITTIQNGTEYSIRLGGKDDFVSALVKHNSSSYSVRLFEDDLDCLASLKTVSTNPNGSLLINVRDRRNGAFRAIQLSNTNDVSVVIRKIIYIAKLPEYKVSMGDTFSGILKNKLHGKYTKAEILKVNPGLNPDQIRAFQIIKLPRKQPNQHVDLRGRKRSDR